MECQGRRPRQDRSKLIVKDSQCSADPAVNAMNQVVDEKIKYIVGEVCSSASIPISEIAEANKIVQISPTSTNPSVTLNKDGSTKTVSSSAPASSTPSRDW